MADSDSDDNTPHQQSTKGETKGSTADHNSDGKKMDDDNKALYIVYIYSGENIPISDRRGTTDPYIVAKLETQRKESPVVKETLDPKWDNAVLLLPYSGSPDANVLLELWDWNMIQSHSHLGSIKFQSNYKTPGHRAEIKQLEKDGKVIVGGKDGKKPTKIKLKLWNLNPFQFTGRLIFTRFVARKVRFSANREILKVKSQKIRGQEKEKEKEKEAESRRNNPYWKFTWGDQIVKYGKGLSKIVQDQYGLNTCTWETVEGGLEFEFNEKTVLEQKMHIQFYVDSIHHDEPYEASVYIHEIIDPILVEIIAAYATKIHLRTKNFYTEPVGMDYTYKII